MDGDGLKYFSIIDREIAVRLPDSVPEAIALLVSEFTTCQCYKFAGTVLSGLTRTCGC